MGVFFEDLGVFLLLHFVVWLCDVALLAAVTLSTPRSNLNFQRCRFPPSHVAAEYLFRRKPVNARASRHMPCGSPRTYVLKLRTTGDQ